MDSDGKTKKNLVVFILVILVATGLLIIGIILICLHIKTIGTEMKIDYTYCQDESAPDKTGCDKQVDPSSSHIPCICYLKINLTDPISSPVTIYYELLDYDQTRAGYASSKDAIQLAGNLSQVVSKNCGNYSYEETPGGKKPIAPCGELADSMFFDQYTLFYDNSDMLVPSIEIGLDGITEEDKKQYRNPPGDLQAAFKNFSKPKSWPISVTELDNIDQNDNGFQNERFIGWMKTDMKRKPAFRINHTGIFEDCLPAGSYKFRVYYFYSNYVTGPRIAIISSVHTVTNSGQLIAGILLLLIGMCLISVLAYYKIVQRSYVPCNLDCDQK